jgi:hypothetical protein
MPKLSIVYSCVWGGGEVKSTRERSELGLVTWSCEHVNESYKQAKQQQRTGTHKKQRDERAWLERA